MILIKKVLFIIVLIPVIFFIIGIADDFSTIQLLLILIGFCIAILLVFKWIEKPKKVKVRPNKISDFAKHYGFIFSHTSGSLIVGNPFRGILVVGGAGSGKSESVALPIINQTMQKGQSGIIYDFKYPSLTTDFMKFKTYHNADLQPCILNFNDVLSSQRVNPLNPVYIPSSSYAREYATSIIANLDKESMKKKDIWIRSAIDVLTACIWYLKKHYPQYCTLPHAFRMVLQKDEDLMKILAQDFEIEDMVKSIINAIERNAGGQVAGQIGTLQSMIGQVNTPEVAYLLTGNDFNLDINNPQEPKLLSIGTSPQLVNTHAPAISLVINVATKLMNTQGRNPSFILLDEFPTLYIPEIERLPATARSNKVSTVLLCQDLSQIDDSYGTTKREVIISNLGTQFYGRVSNQKTAKYVSDLFGKDDVEMQSVSQSSSGLFKGSNSVSQSLQERSNLKPQELLKFEAGTFAGTTVESPTPIFKEQFHMVQRPDVNISLQFDRKFNDIDANFEKVYQDIKNIFDEQKQAKNRFNEDKNYKI